MTRRIFGLAALLGAVEVFNLATTHHGGRRVRMFTPVQLKPAEILDLSVWKVGLPTTEEVKQPQLASYAGADFKAVAFVQFTAHCGDKAQQGSKYARSELREMNPDGSMAAWSSTAGTHVMDLTQRITHLPVVKPALVCGQIHNTSDYLILVELNGKSLAVRYIDNVVGVLDSNYMLGTTFDLKIVAGNGFVDVYYNGVRKVHQAMAKTGLYFKAGCYVQSNTSTGDAPSAYGQVEISRLAITHS
jgi:hypothetical protein